MNYLSDFLVIRTLNHDGKNKIRHGVRIVGGGVSNVQ